MFLIWFLFSLALCAYYSAHFRICQIDYTYN
nr:MAG TPA: Ligand-gated ion channel [Caudoviricetes sp.]